MLYNESYTERNVERQDGYTLQKRKPLPGA